MNKIKKAIKNILPYGIVKKINQKKLETPKLQTEKIVFSNGPNVYNKTGDKMMVYYLQDIHYAHMPSTLTYGRMPKDILWDRFDYRLKYHMYTGMDILKTVGQPIKKFAMSLEAEAICPEAHRIFSKNPELNKEFDAIFTFNTYELDKFSNAVFMPCSTVWIGTKMGGGALNENAYTKKIKNLSMIASDKNMTKYHLARRSIAQKLKKAGLADTFGRFDGGEYLDHIADALEDYRFQVVIENQSSEYVFTEQILNCFATMTIPIYFGASKIGDFFNEDGIIKIFENDFDNIEKAIKNIATKEYYDEHIDAVKDNYNRSLEYLSREDYLMKNYGDILKY